MKIALIEPYLVDYTGHYYNFVTELRKGFSEIDKRDVVDIFVSEKCTVDGHFLKVLPDIPHLDDKSKNLLTKISENLGYISRFYKVLRRVEKQYDILIFTTADGFRLLLLLFYMLFKKQVYFYSQEFFKSHDERFILKFARRLRNSAFILTPISLNKDHTELVKILNKKNFKIISDVPYPLRPLKNYELRQTDNKLFSISYLGAARKVKGFVNVVEFVLWCKNNNQSDYHFILQCNGAYEDDVKKAIKTLTREILDRVTIIDHNLTEYEYSKTLHESSIILLLYEPSYYKNSISGILLEAFSFGKPVIVRGGSWLADQVKKYGGGVVVDDTGPESLKVAVEEIRLNYGKYSLEALKAGEALYKKHNGSELAKLIKTLTFINHSNNSHNEN